MCIKIGEGIIASGIEKTIKNIVILSQIGMKRTDDVIRRIMKKRIINLLYISFLFKKGTILSSIIK